MALHDVQVAAVVGYAIDNTMETFLPAVLQLLASLLESDRVALAEGSEGEAPVRHALHLASTTLSWGTLYYCNCHLAVPKHSTHLALLVDEFSQPQA